MAFDISIPDTLRINGFDWKVVVTDNLINTSDCFGVTDTVGQKIFLSQDTPPQNVICTLLHELIHVIIWQGGLRNVIDRKEEEIIAAAVSQGLYQVLKENDLFTQNPEEKKAVVV